jgi:hypothetical protein
VTGLEERHFAFFAQADGRWRREWRGPVAAPPPLRPRESKRRRANAVRAWLARVVPVEPGEIALDVTHAGWPVGDFVWAQFDPVRMRVTWPETHAFLVIDTGTLQIAGHTESPRPVRSTAQHLVVDVTGTPLAPCLAQIDGRFLLSPAGGASFLPTCATPAVLRLGAMVAAYAPVLLSRDAVGPRVACASMR